MVLSGARASSNQQSAISFYPGDHYVDWIAVDGYDRKHYGATGFSTIFGGFYDQWKSHNKPIMIGETGAFSSDQNVAGTRQSAASGPPYLQAQFIQGIRQDAPRFPLIKAVLYFDSAAKGGNWTLDPSLQSGSTESGEQAFRNLLDSSYFSFRDG